MKENRRGWFKFYTKDLTKENLTKLFDAGFSFGGWSTKGDIAKLKLYHPELPELKEGEEIPEYKVDIQHFGVNTITNIWGSGFYHEGAVPVNTKHDQFVKTWDEEYKKCEVGLIAQKSEEAHGEEIPEDRQWVWNR